MAASSGVTFDASTAAVRPFSPCVLVHHSSYLDQLGFVGRCDWRYHFIHRLFGLVNNDAPSFLI